MSGDCSRRYKREGRATNTTRGVRSRGETAGLDESGLEAALVGRKNFTAIRFARTGFGSLKGRGADENESIQRGIIVVRKDAPKVLSGYRNRERDKKKL